MDQQKKCWLFEIITSWAIQAIANGHINTLINVNIFLCANFSHFLEKKIILLCKVAGIALKKKFSI